MTNRLTLSAIAVAVLFLAAAHGAQAQQVGPGVGAGAIAGAASGAVAGSQSGAGASAGISLDQTFAATQPLARSTLEYDGTYTIRNVPNVIAPNIFPTAPCTGSSSLGVGVAGFGISGGTAWIFENCEHRENARLLHAMGDVANAKVSLCMQSTMANHPMCPKPVATPQPAKTSALDARDPRVTTSSEPGRQGTAISKSEEDKRLTLAAMSDDPKREQCKYARDINDPILASRFGCK